MQYCKQFQSVDEFIDCIRRGGEVEFIYREKAYSVTHHADSIFVIEACNESSEKQFSTPRGALEYQLEDRKLKDVLLDLDITFRTF